MRLASFGQSIAHVNLNAGSFEVRPSPPDWIKAYIGARGLGVRYVLEAGPRCRASLVRPASLSREIEASNRESRGPVRIVDQAHHCDRVVGPGQRV